MLLATGVTVANSGLVSSQGTRGMIAAAAEVLSDPASLFAARSPGGRADGALTDTKPARALADDAALLPPAEERVLTNVRDRPPIPFVDAEPPAGAIPFVEAPGAVPATPVAAAAVPPGGLVGLPGGGSLLPGGGIPGGGTGGGGGGGGNGGGGNDGGGGGGGGGVPEPSTWAMLILGFFGTAAALRRRKAPPVGEAG